MRVYPHEKPKVRWRKGGGGERESEREREREREREKFIHNQEVTGRRKVCCEGAEAEG